MSFICNIAVCVPNRASLACDFAVHRLFTTGGSTLTAFVIGSFGMVAGSLLGWHLLSGQLGPTGWKVVACLCASYVGGSVNFAAVAKVCK